MDPYFFPSGVLLWASVPSGDLVVADLRKVHNTCSKWTAVEMLQDRTDFNKTEHIPSAIIAIIWSVLLKSVLLWSIFTAVHFFLLPPYENLNMWLHLVWNNSVPSLTINFNCKQMRVYSGYAGTIDPIKTNFWMTIVNEIWQNGS